MIIKAKLLIINKMKIRNAKKEDLKEIVSIFVTESKKRPFLQKWTKKSATDDIKPFLKKKELWVAVLDEKIVGFIMVGITSSNKKIAYISEIWVTENYQGKGVGKSLLKFIEKYHKKKGVDRIRLTSYNKSKAIGFYKKFNYKVSEEVTPLEKKLR
jgi:ribosomal protein S18 acetylase RimI-like enzyme